MCVRVREHRGLACVRVCRCKQVIEHDVFKAPAFCAAQPPHPSQGRQDLQANLLRIQRRRKRREKCNIVKMKSEPSVPLFHYFLFQHLSGGRPGDDQGNGTREAKEKEQL